MKMTIKDLENMGGNGSYNKEFGGVLEIDRTHIDTNFKVDGHKVLLQQKNTKQIQMPMNSNSESPIYLIASVDKSGNLVISGFGVYKKHVIAKSVDLVFDKDGDLIPYSESEKSSHAHQWQEVSPGIYGRKPHDKKNHQPIDSLFNALINKIVKFNKSKKKWIQG